MEKRRTTDFSVIAFFVHYRNTRIRSPESADISPFWPFFSCCAPQYDPRLRRRSNVV